MPEHKPMLSVPEQIEHLKEKGIAFEICSEKDATDYLMNNNNYFKLTSYRKNYDKYTTGDRAGQYINLDFAYLRDLSIIDMKLRYACLQLALDVEHYAKMEILRDAVLHGEDGYLICRDFINSLNAEQSRRLKTELEWSRRSVYCRDLYRKYGTADPPIWVFLELIPFGRLVSFYGFCAGRYDDRQMMDRHFVLKTCKEIRNASAHSSCILNDLHPDTSTIPYRYSVRDKVMSIQGMTKTACSRRLSNARMQQIVTLLYGHTIIVTSDGVRRKASDLLQNLAVRILQNESYYSGNEMVRSSLKFLCCVISEWF